MVEKQNRATAAVACETLATGGFSSGGEITSGANQGGIARHLGAIRLNYARHPCAWFDLGSLCTAACTAFSSRATARWRTSYPTSQTLSLSFCIAQPLNTLSLSLSLSHTAVAASSASGPTRHRGPGPSASMTVNIGNSGAIHMAGTLENYRRQNAARLIMRAPRAGLLGSGSGSHLAHTFHMRSMVQKILVQVQYSEAIVRQQRLPQCRGALLVNAIEGEVQCGEPTITLQCLCHCPPGRTDAIRFNV